MKKLYLSMIVLSLFCICSAQEINKSIWVGEKAKEVLIGLLNENEGLRGPLFNGYYQEKYANYKPDENYISCLKNADLQELSFTIVLASWCHDSHVEVPPIMKTLHVAGIDNSQIKIIAVDYQKQADGLDISNLKIKKVPTLIVFRNKNEIGRIVESPNCSAEQDLAEIMGVTKKVKS